MADHTDLTDTVRAAADAVVARNRTHRQAAAHQQQIDQQVRNQAAAYAKASSPPRLTLHAQGLLRWAAITAGLLTFGLVADQLWQHTTLAAVGYVTTAIAALLTTMYARDDDHGPRHLLTRDMPHDLYNQQLQALTSRLGADTPEAVAAILDGLPNPPLRADDLADIVESITGDPPPQHPVLNQLLNDQQPDTVDHPTSCTTTNHN